VLTLRAEFDSDPEGTMESATLLVEFGDHMSMDRVTPMVTGIAAYGNVFNGHSERSFVVEVFRASKLLHLKDQLGRWERLGFLRWSEDP
jgi:hypothetical protein